MAITRTTQPSAGSSVVIQDEGAALTARAKLNFTGAGVTVSDNAGTSATDVTIPGGGGSFTSSIPALTTTAVTSQPATGQPVATLNGVSGIVAGWTVILGADTVTAERKTVLSVSGNNVTFTTNITGTHPTTEVVAYSSAPLDNDYMSLVSYQQVAGQKRFMATVLSGVTPGAAPSASVPYSFDGTAGLRSRANGGGGIIVVPRAETKPVVDWINDSTNSGGYLFHLTQSLPPSTTNPGPNGASNGTPLAIGVQGSGGNGILIAKDGPQGNGIYIDQKGVVTNATAIGLVVSQASTAAVGVSISQTEPNAAAGIQFTTSGHTPLLGQKLMSWLSATASSFGGFIDAQTGAVNSQSPVIADSTVANSYAALVYRGKGIPPASLAFIDENGSLAAGTTDQGPAVRLYAASNVNPYSAQIRLSKNIQGILISAGNGAARPGAEAPEAVAEFGVANGVRLGHGHDVTVSPLTVPTGVALTGAGSTGGSTTYGYRVAAVNAKGTTIASATVSTAVGQASLSAGSPIIISWAASLGAASYKVYGRTSGSELLIATVTVPTRTVTDAVMKAATSRTTSADVATTAFNNTVTSASGAFTQDDVDSTIVITSGSFSGYNTGPGYNGYEYHGHIVSVTDASTIVVSGVVGATVTGATMVISRPASNILKSATAAFTISDVGKGISAPIGAAGATTWGYITSYVNATTVYVSITATTAMTAGTVTITGGTVPLTFTDDGTVTPSGALPGNPAGSKLKVQAWQSQTGNQIEVLDSTGTAQWGVAPSGLPRWIAAGNVQTTVGAAGAASAPPASPSKYLKVVGDDGATYVVPAYAAT